MSSFCDMPQNTQFLQDLSFLLFKTETKQCAVIQIQIYQ